MNPTTSVFVALCIIFLVQNCNGEYAEGLTCQQAVSELIKKNIKIVGECAKKLNLKTGKEKNENKSCLMKCVLMAGGTLDENGAPDAIGVMIYVEQNFPFSSHEWVRAQVMSCFDTITTIDINDPTCKSYDPMIKCALSGLSTICAAP